MLRPLNENKSQFNVWVRSPFLFHQPHHPAYVTKLKIEKFCKVVLNFTNL